MQFHRLSQIYQPKLIIPLGKERTSNIMSVSQKLLQDLGLIAQSGPGTFLYLPLAIRSLKKLRKIVEDELNGVGAQEIIMPSLLSEQHFKLTGRNNLPELFKVKDRHDKTLILGPTHEEAIVNYVASVRPSYKHLPLKFYQITSKFRDEIKPRFGLMRSREFLMKDLYCFNQSEESSLALYEAINNSYHNILKKLDVPYSCVQGSAGEIGGSLSHEFHVLAPTGEDKLIICKDCSNGYNTEQEKSPAMECKVCHGKNVTLKTGIEIAHSFLLGKRYTKPLQCVFINEQNQSQFMDMSCHGIGLSRLLAAVVEVSPNPDCITWPKHISPFSVCVIPPKAGSKEESKGESTLEILLDIITRQFVDDTVLDDRSDLTIGKRLKESKRMGYPYIVAIGKAILDEVPKVELHDTQTGSVDILSPVDLPAILQKKSAL